MTLIPVAALSHLPRSTRLREILFHYIPDAGRFPSGAFGFGKFRALFLEQIRCDDPCSQSISEAATACSASAPNVQLGS